MKLTQIFKAMFSPAPRVAPADCFAHIRSGEALLVDVREPKEWEAGVAQSAALLPLSDLKGDRKKWSRFLADSGGREILLYCAVGGRAGMAAQILAAEGHRASNAGGFREWVASGWPVVRAQETPEAT
jgi:rhodanese-related sulfurtransferase